MDMKISKAVNKDGSVELYFEQVGHWDDLDLIANILVEENKCHIIKENDMVTDKDVHMQLGNVEFILRHHYMLGNYLYTADPSDVPVLEHIANNVINSIKVKLANRQM